MIRNLTVTLIHFLLILGFFCTHIPAFGGSKPSINPASAPKIPERQRYLAIVIFNYESDPKVDDERIENAGRLGCNAAEISVHWDQVYPTRNSAPNWRVVDSHVNTALRMGMKVAIRIQVAREPGRIDGFWTNDQTMQAADDARMNFGGAAQFSFAHQPTLELAKDFVRQVTQHFQYLQEQDQLLFMSATASPIQEGEFSPRNGRGDTTYPIPFDYSDPMKQGFRQWLQGRMSLDAVNRRWGSDFSKWDAVSPPPYNQSDPYVSFSRGHWGEDWYVFRHLMLKRFLDETNRTIKEVNGSIQVVNQHGCVWDRQSGLRGTFAFKNLAQNADGVKINDGPDYNHRFSMDVVRSNIKAGGWVCNEVDGLFHNSVTVGRFYDQVSESFEHGARLVTLANFGGWDARDMLNQLIQQVVSRGLLNQPVTQVQTGSNTTYKLSSMVKDDVADPSGRASDQWSREYVQNGRKAVNIVINEDWLEDNANQDPRVSHTIPNQTAYVDKSFEFSIPTSTFEDPDGSITKVEVSSGLPALGLSANGVTISGTPNSTGTITVTVRAIDNKNSPVSTQFQINVLGQNANQSPVVSQTIQDRTALVGQDYSFKIPDETFKDPDGKIVSINASDLPGGLSYDSNTYTISGKPTNEGVSTITLKATDDKGISVSTSFKLTVNKPDDTNKAPVVSKTIPAQTATVGQNFSYTIEKETFSDPDGQIASLDVSGLTSGLNYDADSRTIKGSPNTAGTITVKVKATDNKGANVTTEFRLTINGSNSAEQLALLEPTVDCSTGEIKFRTSGGDGSKIEFRAVGIVEDWTTNTTFTIPAWLRNGTTFDIQARQNGKEIKFTYTTPCKGYEPPTVDKPMSDQTYPISQFFILKIPSETFKASTPLEWAVSALPPGLAFDKVTHAISGTPTKAGSTTITITVTDDRAAKVDDVFVLTIKDNAALTILAPTISCETGKLTIRTEGGNGSALTYSISGIADWSSNPTFTIGLDKLSGTELKLLARQSDREFSYIYKTTCTAPGSSTMADQTIVVGESYTYVLPDPGGGITYNVSGLPDGLTYNAITRTISGSATQVGATTLSIKAVDDKGNAIGALTFKLVVVTKPSTSGNFEGFLDLVSCLNVAGWVWNGDQPNTPLTVEFLVGSTLESARLVGSVQAGLFRQDLKDSGKGNGSHGYRWDTADELKNNQTYSIWGRVQGTTYMLKGSPKTLVCNGNGTTIKPTDPTTNQPPIGPALSSLSARVNTAYLTILPAFTDPEGGTLKYEVSGSPAGLAFDVISRGLSGTVSTAGGYKLTYTATDNQSAKTSISITFNVAASNGTVPTTPFTPTTPTTPTTNQAPVGPSLSSLSATANTAFVTVLPAFTDPESGTLKYEMSGLPAGLAFDVISRGLSGTVATAGSYKLAYTATDNQGAKTSIDITLNVATSNGTVPTTPSTPTTPTTPTTNQPPVGPALSSLSATVNTAFVTVLPAFTDPESGTLKYEVSGLPVGLAFDVITRGLSGTVTTAGSYKLTYTATDNQGAKTSIDITLTVNPGTTNPSTSALVVLAPDYDCQTGKITFRTSGGDNTQIEYKAAGITDWTTTATQTLYLTMREGSTFDIEVRQSQKVVKYSYTTTCASGKSPISDQIITKGLFYTITLPEAGTGTQLEVTGLPDGISFDASNRTASGKPQNPGEYMVLVKSTGSDQKSYTIDFKLTVREPQLTLQLMKAGNAAVRQVIQEMNDNTSVGINNLPDRVNFFCTSNVPVGSIAFELTGSSPSNYVDNQAPFGLFGDDDGVKPQVGTYVLRLAAFTGANGSGEKIVTKNVTFSFVQGGGRIGALTVSDNAETAGESWQVYPNPIRETINLTLPTKSPDQTKAARPYRFSLSSITGNQWELQDHSSTNSTHKVVLDVKTLQLPTGLYFLQIDNGAGVLKVIKVLKQ